MCCFDLISMPRGAQELLLAIYIQELLLTVLKGPEDAGNWTQIGEVQGKHPTYCNNTLALK